MSDASGQCKIDLVTEAEGFASLKQVWNKLVEEAHYDITTRWEWMYSWWEVYHNDRELYILTFSVQDTIVAIFPLQRVSVKAYGLKRKVIQFLGTGENERDETCSEYLDLIIAVEYREQVIDAFLCYMLDRAFDWHSIQLSDIRKSSANYAVLIANNKAVRMECIESQIKAPYIVLPDSWEELLISSRINAREQLNRKYNLLNKEGHVEFRRYSGADISEPIMQCFIDLHQKRWQGTGNPGCFASRLFTDFHKKLLVQFKQDKQVVIYFLFVNNEAVAVRYCFEFDRKIYDYQTGLDMTFKTRSSPGTVLLAHVIKDSIDRGNTRYEFFKGKKTSYKYKWTDKDEALVTVILSNRKLKNTIDRAIDRLTGFLRILRRRFST